MKKPIKRIPSRGRADFERMMSMTEEEIMRTSPPELANLPDDFFDTPGVVVMPGPKRAISIRVDQDVLDWFKATGSLYQKRMNAVLRAYMSAEQRRSHPVHKVSEPRADSARGSRRRKVR